MNRIYQLKTLAVIDALNAKLAKKGYDEQVLIDILSWVLQKDPRPWCETYVDLFKTELNPECHTITGKICGIQVETIEDPLIYGVRMVDLLVDQVYKGKRNPLFFKEKRKNSNDSQ